MVAITNCDVRILDKTNFDNVCYAFPEISDQFAVHTKMKYNNAVNVSRRQSVDVRKSFDNARNKKILRSIAQHQGMNDDTDGSDSDSIDNDAGSTQRSKRYNKSSLEDGDVKRLAFRLETAASKLDSYVYLLQGVIPKDIAAVNIVERLERLEEKVDRLFNVTYGDTSNVRVGKTKKGGTDTDMRTKESKSNGDSGIGPEI